MRQKTLRGKTRILLWIVLPVLVVGGAITILLIAYLTPPMVSFLNRHFQSNLRLASNLGMRVCETHFNYLLELRLEADVEMNLALQNEALQEIKGISDQIPPVHLMVTDSQGQVQVCSLDLGADAIALKPLAIGSDAVVDLSLHGEPVKAHHRYFPFWGWRIISFIRQADYIRPIAMAKRIVYLGTIGVLLSVLLTLVIVFQRFVNQPLQRLIQATQTVAQGRYQRIPSWRPDEIGQLVQAFNAMVEGLEKKGIEVKNLLERLRLSEHRFRTLFESAPMGIGVATLDGEFWESNRSLLTLLGEKPGSGGPPLHLERIQAESGDFDRILAQLKQAGGILQNHETRWKRADGRDFDVRLTLSRIRLGPTDVLVIIAEDITEQKQLEARLQQRQKMEAIGTLVGGIAHDFNNILSIILGNIELAIADIPEWDERHELLQEVRTASIRARDVVRQLLAFSQKVPEKREPLDLGALVTEALRMMRATLPASIRFETDIDEGTAPILADPTQLHQLLLNLCANAGDAMNEHGGVLKISLSNVRLGPDSPGPGLEPGDYVKLRLSDTGQGIPPGDLKRIFDPYFTTKEVGKGSGMGLAVAHGIVQRHRGKIQVHSRLGQGTAIEVFFPALEGPLPTPAEPGPSLSRGSGRILFVDDEPGVIRLHQQGLERLGYQVESTPDPRQALQWVQRDPGRFDLLVTDMTMPDMSGDQLVREVRAIRRIPVILCTGYSQRINAETAHAMGIQTYLEKPVSPEELARAVQQLIEDPPPAESR